MGENSKIEWTDASWTPIRARNLATGKVGWHCEHDTTGCINCYSEGMNARLGTGLPFKPGHRKDIELFLDEKMLLAPLRWRKPRMIFVCSMTDLFASFVPDEWIDRVFAVMALCPQHTFQCLTKRADRMRAYCSAPDITQRVARAADAVLVDRDHYPVEVWAAIPGFPEHEASSHGRIRRGTTILKEQVNQRFDRASVTLWRQNVPKTIWVHTLVLLAHRGAAPVGDEACHRNGDQRDNRLANLRWGTRSDNQGDKVRHGSNGGPAKITREQAAEIRVARQSGETQQSIADRYRVSRSLVSMIEGRRVWPDALAWPLPNCWLGVSAERQQEADERIPHLLQTPAAVRFVSAEPLLGPIDLHSPNCREHGSCSHCPQCLGGVDWLIVGGESGPKARPMHPDWARSLRDQCQAAGVSFFFKQWGEWIEVDGPRCRSIQQGNGRDSSDSWIEKDGRVIPRNDSSNRHYSPYGTSIIRRLGKSRAGRLLDGREHNEFPARAIAPPASAGG